MFVLAQYFSLLKGITHHYPLIFAAALWKMRSPLGPQRAGQTLRPVQLRPPGDFGEILARLEQRPATQLFPASGILWPRVECHRLQGSARLFGLGDAVRWSKAPPVKGRQSESGLDPQTFSHWAWPLDSVLSLRFLSFYRNRISDLLHSRYLHYDS